MVTLQPGQMLGSYRIIEQIGQGGMASVFRAYHAAMDRDVAVKILPFQLAHNDEFIRRFQREVRVIAKLEHPHILPVYDSGEYQGIPYLVMRYLDSGTLKDRIQAGPLSLEEIDHLFTQLAGALAYAHAHDVIHRDIKPSNALVNDRDDVFLTDFGIAKLVESTSTLTASGAITGTPSYMSPEQSQGVQLDARSDIYSLGVVLYEMVTGRVPYEAETPIAVIFKHLEAQLPLPTSIKPGIPPAVERVILKALTKTPEERFVSVIDFLAAWKTALQEKGESVSVPGPQEMGAALDSPEVATVPTPSTQALGSPQTPTPVAPLAKPQRTIEKRWLYWGLGAVIVILVLLAGGYAISQLMAKQPTEPSSPPQAADDTIGSASDAALVSSGQWTSWSGMNIIYALATHNGKVYAGGPGGLTIWNPQDGGFERIAIADGLPDNALTAITFDEDGVLWVGTDAGLALFREGSWLVYDEADGLDSPNVRAIELFGDSMAVGTNYAHEGGGVNLFADGFWQNAPGFPSAYGEQPGKLSNNVNVLLPYQDDLWVGTHYGLGRFDGDGWEIYTVDDGLMGNFVYSLMVDSDQNLLVATDNGVVRYDGETIEPFPQLEGFWVYAMVQDDQGDYWFAGNGGIFRYDPEMADWQFFSEDDGQLPAYTITTAALDDIGVLYFGTEGGGLLRYDGEFTSFTVPNQPTVSAFWRVLPAPDGALWFVEEYGATVDIFDPETETWSQLGEKPYIPLAFDDNDTLWGGGDQGLWWISSEGDTNLTTRHGLPSDNVYALAFRLDNQIWVLTEGGIAVLSDDQVEQVLTVDDIGAPGETFTFIYAADDGSIWVGTDGGVSRYQDDLWEHFTIGNPFTDSFYQPAAVAEADEDVIWLATWGDGVWRYKEDTWQQYLPTDPGVKLPSVEVNTVTVDSKGTVWFGTDQGAAYFDGSNWYAFGIEDGLVHPNVWNIFVAEDGAVWFATSGGISRHLP